MEGGVKGRGSRGVSVERIGQKTFEKVTLIYVCLSYTPMIGEREEKNVFTTVGYVCQDLQIDQIFTYNILYI